MSKTLRSFKGTIYVPRKHDGKKKLAKTKFMGHTSGQHSMAPDDVIPQKRIDFIKYGYPLAFYPKNILIAKKKAYPATRKYNHIKEINAEL